MINVKNIEKIGMCGDLVEIKFDFEFDNSSALPVKTYILGNTTYLIANNSTAVNTVTNISYNYNEGIWTKVLSKSTIPQSNITNVFTKNGNYDVVNNELKGISGIEVMVSSPDTKLIDKTITANNTYNAIDDNANGYSSVTVDVANSYTDSDEGKVVNSGALVSQTSTNITSNGTVNTTLNNSAVVNVPNTYTAGDEGKVVDNGALVAQTAYPSTITVNDTYDTTIYNSITVNVPSGGGSVEEKDVNFYDYDGTCVYSYTAQEFLQLTEMPANPTHTGLTAQGWNWSLSDAKTYVTDYGKLNVGQMYITSDGKTRLYIKLPDGRIYPRLMLYLEDNTELNIDWGDGSNNSIFTTTTADYISERHDYPSSGEYIITITVIRGKFSFSSQNELDHNTLLEDGKNEEDVLSIVYLNSIKKVEIGTGTTHIKRQAFRYCSSLSSITIPHGVEISEDWTFHACYSLLYITIPDTTTLSGNCTFTNCNNLVCLSIPNNITRIGYNTFQYCTTLSSVTLPDSITHIGNNAFTGCYCLTSIVLPKNITKISEYMFSKCDSLSHITIPEKVTQINIHSFEYCRGLAFITIPNNVTSILDSAFEACSSMEYIKFTHSTPPTLSSSNVYRKVSISTIIYVPALVSNLYMDGTNYPSKTSYKYIGYATYELGETLPTLTSDETYTLTWYNTSDDAITGTNPIIEGTGNEVYSRANPVG